MKPIFRTLLVLLVAVAAVAGCASSPGNTAQNQKGQERVPLQY